LLYLFYIYYSVLGILFGKGCFEKKANNVDTVEWDIFNLN